MQLHCLTLLGLITTACVGAPAAAATITSTRETSGSIVIQIQGRIGAGDADVFNQIVRRAGERREAIASVRLNSQGGKLDEGARLAFAIRSGKLATVVDSGAVCASACFLAFAAGTAKFARPGALIGVHRAFENKGLETRASGVATAAMAGFAKELGVPSQIISRMVKTPPTEIAWLEPRDLYLMGVRTSGNIAMATGSGVRFDQATDRLQSANLATVAPLVEKTEDRPVWNQFIEKLIALSAQQNQGAAALTRSCSPESGECAMAVAYLLNDGRQGLASVFQDANGNVKRREVCESNADNDHRECLNWDTGAKYRDVKNTNGKWEQIRSD
ncbi:hypothetical protein ACO2JO_04285 [Leptospira interrogans]